MGMGLPYLKEASIDYVGGEFLIKHKVEKLLPWFKRERIDLFHKLSTSCPQVLKKKFFFRNQFFFFLIFSSLKEKFSIEQNFLFGFFKVKNFFFKRGFLEIYKTNERV